MPNESHTPIHTHTATHSPSKDTILHNAFHKAFNGGIAGSMAMVIQVTSLMWMRTIMNYQYRYGSSTTEAFKILYKDGGVRRFYRGYIPALAIGPLSRFGDTASNAFVLEMFKDSKLPTTVKTVCGSLSAASFRAFLMPIDAIKTTLQVEGKNGISLLRNKIAQHGMKVLFNGTLASMSATFVGHYPWFLTYNLLNARIPKYKETWKKLLRSAFIGFNAAVISDTCSNSLRVIKTTRQTSSDHISYLDSIKRVVDKDGLAGLFGRGLKTRIITNGMQGIMFTIFWRLIEEKLSSRERH